MNEKRIGQTQYDAYGPRPAGSPPRTEPPKDSILHPDNLAKLKVTDTTSSRHPVGASAVNYDVYENVRTNLAQASGVLDRLAFYGHAPPDTIEVNEERVQFVWYKQHEYTIYARLTRGGYVEVDILDFTPFPLAGIDIDYAGAFKWNIFEGMK